MEVESQYFGELRDIARLGGETISLGESATLAELLEKLTKAYGEAFQERLDRKDGYIILINGQLDEVMDGKDTILKNGDRVVFLPITMGG